MAAEMAIVNVSEPAISERENFDLSGPVHLTTVDWTNPCHRRSVAASLVQSVYILERDRQEKREGSQALAPPWWKAFKFQLYRQLVDDADSCIFGTITKGDALMRDLELDIHIVRNGLHQTSRFEIAIQAVRHVVATFGSNNIWLAGHSLGAAMALLAGKNMAKSGVFLDAFLFNSPFFSAPIERIKDKKVKHGLRFAGSVITAGLALAMKNNNQTHRSGGTFLALSAWLPHLFVNPSDHICSEYVGYFEHRRQMEEMGAGAIEKLATQHSMGGLLLNALGKQTEEPPHLIPSAHVTVNRTPARDFKEAHGIHQWWRTDLHLETKSYNYS
ncbi:alpha/beta-Hydrolases superfamily protein [Perilla frutescens var. frutescens]|nr:alpha/beta-Hydrolases superfamily protein [Perilla frutescens var. frutescens]